MPDLKLEIDGRAKPNDVLDVIDWFRNVIDSITAEPEYPLGEACEGLTVWVHDPEDADYEPGPATQFGYRVIATARSGMSNGFTEHLFRNPATNELTSSEAFDYDFYWKED